MTELPKISIITPSLNKVRYVGEAIESVLSQGYPHFEHIVVDGGSSDGTIDVLKKYPHLIWISSPDKGQSDAMNKGFSMSDGEVISYLNADDYYESGAFDTVVKHFKAGVKFVMGRVRVINDDGSTWINDPSVMFSEMIQWWKPAIFCFNPTGYFYLREVQQTVGPFDIDNHYTMDYDFLLKTSLKFKMRKIDAILGNYRHIKDTKSIDYPLSEKWSNPFAFSKKYWRYLPVHEIPYVSVMHHYIIYVKENRRLRRFIDDLTKGIHRKTEDALLYIKLRRAGRVVIFGASKTGRQYFEMCNRMGVEVECFIDNNPSLRGKEFMGVPVYFPSWLLGQRKALTVLVASLGRKAEMGRFLREMTFTGEII